MSTRWIYGFDALDAAIEHCGGDWDEVRGLLGGKGANLADMTGLEIPVPPGFTITSDACNAYLDVGENLPDGLADELAAALKAVEQLTGKTPASPFVQERGKVLDARHDGHRAQHRPQRRGSERHC